MLNITRKVGEKIIVGDDIVLEVMEVSGASVRIGIHAPRSISVYREEIWEAVRAENAAAAQSSSVALPGTAPSGAKSKPADDRPARPARTSVGSAAAKGRN